MKSHDEILQLTVTRRCSFGKRWWAKKSETSTDVTLCPRSRLSSHMMSDSTLLDRIPSHFAANGEIIESRSSESSEMRWTLRIVSCAARCSSAFIRLWPGVPSLNCLPSNTRSSGVVGYRRCRSVQSCKLFPQKPQSSGVREATSSQWWQTSRKLWDPSSNWPVSPTVTFQRKISPGGLRVATWIRSTANSERV